MLWGNGSSLYLQSYHGMEHIYLNMRPQTCSTRVKEQAGTGLLTAPQTGLRLVLPLQGSSEGLWSMHVHLVCVWLIPSYPEGSQFPRKPQAESRAQSHSARRHWLVARLVWCCNRSEHHLHFCSCKSKLLRLVIKIKSLF